MDCAAQPVAAFWSPWSGSVCECVWRRGWGCVRGLQARGQRRRGPGEVKVVGWRGTIGYGGPGGHVSGVTCGRRVDEVWGRSRCRGGGAAGGRSLGGRRARGFVGDRGLGSGRRIRSYHTKEAVLRRESCSFVVSFFLVLYYVQAAASGCCDCDL